jgi:hypothetical protein
MRSITVTLLGCLLGTGCVSAPSNPNEDVLVPGPVADLSETPSAGPDESIASSPLEAHPLPTNSCRGRSDCGSDEACVATLPGISECLTLAEAGEEEPADGPDGQMAPPAGMLRGAARFERRGSAR